MTYRVRIEPIEKPAKLLIVWSDRQVDILENRDESGHYVFSEREHYEPTMLYALSMESGSGLKCIQAMWGRPGSAIAISLPNTLHLRVKVHFVFNPHGKDRALDLFFRDFCMMHKLWGENHVGVQVGYVECNFDNASLPAAFTDFVCDDDRFCIDRITEKEPEFFHVFYVRSVDGSPVSGVACNYPQPFIVLAYDRVSSLLTHESGHALGLHHNGDIPDCSDSVMQVLKNDTQNIMIESSGITNRRRLSIGQIIQGHVNVKSILNRGSLSARRTSDFILTISDKFQCGSVLLPGLGHGLPKIDGQKWLTPIERYVFSDCAIGIDKMESLAIAFANENRDVYNQVKGHIESLHIESDKYDAKEIARCLKGISCKWIGIDIDEHMERLEVEVESEREEYTFMKRKVTENPIKKLALQRMRKIDSKINDQSI